MAEDTNTAGGVQAPNTSGGATGISKLFNKIKSKINALLSARRNSQAKLDKKKNQSNDFKTKFLEFLLEIILLLGIFTDFIRKINDFLGKGKKYEPKLKRTLIECLNANIACNLDDTFKASDLYPNTYFSLPVSKLDFFGLLKMDPNSRSGKIFYGNTGNITLNKTIKDAINSPNTPKLWDNTLYVTYDNTIGSATYNHIKFGIINTYLDKPVNALVTNLVNKIDLIPNFSMLLNLFDNIYGSFSFSVKPNKIDPYSLFNRLALNKIIERVLDGGEDLTINDSFFSFSNEDLFDIERSGQNLTNNFLEIVSCNNAESVILPNELYPILEQIVSAGTFNEQTQIIEAGMSTLQLLASKNVTVLNLPKFQIEFHINIFKQLTNILVGYVYSPEFLTIMMIYFKLANTNPGSPEPIQYNDFIDFIKKTKNILKCIVWSYFKLLLLLIILPIIIRKLVTEANIERFERNREKYALYVEQYLALKGLLETVKSTKLLTEMVSAL
jgi:hypothetical protein